MCAAHHQQHHHQPHHHLHHHLPHPHHSHAHQWQHHLVQNPPPLLCNPGLQNLSFENPASVNAVTAGNNGTITSTNGTNNSASNLNSSPPGTSTPTSSTTGTSTGKSTKGASKMRRDMINGEIANLRDLLPLPSSTRQRLSQLQLMALVCVYVRKSNYFDQVFKTLGKPQHYIDLPSFGFSKALNGFLMMTTQTGKLLYISDNAAEYLGHSMEDLLIHGDSVYDIIDKQDHASIQAELMRNAPNLNNEASLSSTSSHEKRIFLCRMNVSRNSRRQMRFGDQKVVLIEGRFSGLLPLCSRSEPVFISWCTPVAMPETRESVVQGATNIYTSTHTMDLKFNSIDQNGEHYLGYNKKELKGVSLYNLLHPTSLKEVQSKHRLITQSENERSCILLIQLQRQDGFYIWCHLVIQVKESTDQDQAPYIVCTNQILTRDEAAVMKANNWLYHYYMVQSRLQYNLAYGGQPSTIAALYPQMMHMISPTFVQNFDGCNSSLGFSDQYTPNGTGPYDNYSAFNTFTRYGDNKKILETTEKFYSSQRSPVDCNRSESSTPPPMNLHYNTQVPNYGDSDEYQVPNHIYGAKRHYYPDPRDVSNGPDVSYHEEHKRRNDMNPSPVEYAVNGTTSSPEDNNNNCEDTDKIKK